MAEVTEEERHAAIGRALDRWRGIGIALEEAFGVVGVHQRFLRFFASWCSERMSAGAEAKGP